MPEYRLATPREKPPHCSTVAVCSTSDIGLRSNILREFGLIGDYKYRFIDQPGGWLGDKTEVDVPYLTNLRLDPFERTGWPESGTKSGSQEYFQWFKYEFWRFVFVQQQVEKLAMTAVEFPPMQRGRASTLMP